MRGAKSIGLMGVLVGLLSLAASGPCVDEEAIREVEARRAALLSERLPKEELWALVEQRGRALEETAKLRRALAGVEARVATLESRAAALEAAVAQAEAQREAVAAERRDADAERTRAEAELASVEQTIRALEAGAPDGSAAP